VPTFLMGGTLPAAVRAVTRAADSGRRSVGLLYALNTLGAVVGAMVTTFVLLELVGIRQTLWLACLLNLLIALAARALARFLFRRALRPRFVIEGEDMPPQLLPKPVFLDFP